MNMKITDIDIFQIMSSPVVSYLTSDIDELIRLMMKYGRSMDNISIIDAASLMNDQKI